LPYLSSKKSDKKSAGPTRIERLGEGLNGRPSTSLVQIDGRLIEGEKEDDVGSPTLFAKKPVESRFLK